tara:strand:- start:1290 stop:1973 length:684 start_codon:yes stop_codon:yes gene_type:complete
MDVSKYERLDHNKFDPDKVDYRIKKMVEDVVRSYGANWQKKDDWVESVFQAWLRAFHDVDPRALQQALYNFLLTRTDKFIPNLAVFRAEVFKYLQRDGQLKRGELKSCGKCFVRGLREVAIHFEIAPERFFFNKGQPFVHVFTVNCDCEAGGSRPGDRLSTFVARIQEEVDTTHNIRYFFVNHEGFYDDGKPRKRLKMQDRILAEDYAMVKAVKNPNNPWKKISDAL